MKGIRQAITLLAAVSIVAVALTAAVGALASTDGSESVSGVATEYAVVQLANAPIASYEGGLPGLPATKPTPGEKLDLTSEAAQKYADFLDSKRADYKSWLQRHAPTAEVLHEYKVVFNGLALKLNGVPLDRLAQGPGVAAVTHSWLYKPTMNVSTGLVGAAEVWPTLGGQENAGEGLKVGIIDTGIDDTHRFFACKDDDGNGHADIVHKVYASGVAFDPSNTIVFDHGTHVAGTVAGCVITLGADEPVTGTISGMAPGAELWDYNVFPGFGAGFVAFGGSAFSHDIIAALEDTVEDEMDVINMSLGGGVEGPHDTLAEAVDATVDAGVIAAVAAGNSGPGDMTVASPGVAANAITAGASTNPHFIGIEVTVGTDTFGAALGDFENFDPAITADYTVTEPANGCTTISTDLTGEIALIDRGACTFTTKIRNAQDAGAVGVLIVNNVAGDPVGMAHDGTDPFPDIPAAMVSKDNGDAMKPSGTVTVDGTHVREFVTGNADIIAGFSSRGPTAFTYRIKPDVTAPGVNVYSSVFNDDFAMFQGTSMATPHVAGAAVLLLHKSIDDGDRWSSAEVKSALTNTAKRPVWDHVTGMDETGVLDRGGGRIAMVAATGTPVTLDPVSVSFGLWTGNKPVEASVEVAFTNQGDSAVTCTLSVTGSPFVEVSPTSLALDVDETASVTVSLDGGRDILSGDHSGDLIASCDGTELLSPWWVRVERTSGGSHGLQSLETAAGGGSATFALLATVAAAASVGALAGLLCFRRRKE